MLFGVSQGAPFLQKLTKGRRLGGQNARSIWYMMYVDWVHCDLVPIDELFGLSMAEEFDVCILQIEISQCQ